MDHEDPTLDVEVALREEEELAALAELGAAWTAKEEEPSGTPPGDAAATPGEAGSDAEKAPSGPPQQVTRGEGPKVLDCCTTDSFWEPFWYPFLGPTRTQFYKKYQNGVPKSCQKGGRLLPQQSPNNRPQQSPPKPI